MKDRKTYKRINNMTLEARYSAPFSVESRSIRTMTPKISKGKVDERMPAANPKLLIIGRSSELRIAFPGTVIF